MYSFTVPHTIRFKDRIRENVYVKEGCAYKISILSETSLHLLLACSSLPSFSWKPPQEAGKFLGWRGKFHSWCLYLQKFLASQHNAKPETASLDEEHKFTNKIIIMGSSRSTSLNVKAGRRGSTKGINSAWQMSHEKHETQQPKPDCLWQLTWHASKYKVLKFHQRYIHAKIIPPPIPNEHTHAYSQTLYIWLPHVYPCFRQRIHSSETAAW